MQSAVGFIDTGITFILKIASQMILMTYVIMLRIMLEFGIFFCTSKLRHSNQSGVKLSGSIRSIRRTISVCSGNESFRNFAALNSCLNLPLKQIVFNNNTNNFYFGLQITLLLLSLFSSIKIKITKYPWRSPNYRGETLAQLK